MKQIDFKGKYKLLCLRVKRGFHIFISGFGFKFSIILVVLCAVVSLWLLIPSLFDRDPVMSYFTHKLELPMSYEMSGTVKIVDYEGNIVNDDVTLFVGGYSNKVGSDVDYKLVFSSPKKENYYVVITYKDQNGKECLFTKEIMFPDNGHIIQEDFLIYG